MTEAAKRIDAKLVLVNQPVWERQPGETPGQYLWFTRYKEARLEGNSIADVRQKNGMKPGYDKVLRKWSAENRWVFRIEAYRDFLEAKKAEQRLKDIEEMNDRQSSYGRLLQQVAMAVVTEKQLAGKEEGGEGLKLTVDQIARWVEVGARVERTARGAPTEIKADAELPEETRKRMESIYSDAMEKLGEVKPSEDCLEQKEVQFESVEKE